MSKRISLIFVLLISLIIFSSCSKKNEQTTVKDENNNDVQLVNVDDKDLSESDKDLKEVDYKEVYDQLSSKGKWVQVSGQELGIDMSTQTSAADPDFQRSIFSYITGVNDAHAEADVDVGMFFVWQPSPDLAVSVTSGDVQPVQPAYIPYSNGNWVNTDAGWYFQAPTQEEEIVHHYGRWAYSDEVGWVWVPGRVWAPAWVDWRESDDYVAWAPVPPSVYVVHDEFYCPPIPVERYYVVERRHFCDPQVYRYHTFVDRQVIVNNWTWPTGIFVEHKTIINRGPDVRVIEKYSGRTIDQVKIEHVRNISDIKHNDKEIRTYSPEFKKVKNDQKIKKEVSQPKSFAKYNDVKKNSPLADKKGNENNANDNKQNMQNKKDDAIQRNGAELNKNNSKDNRVNKNNNSDNKNRSFDQKNSQRKKDNSVNKRNNSGNNKNDNSSKNNGNVNKDSHSKNNGNVNKNNTKTQRGNDRGTNKGNNNKSPQKNNSGKDKNNSGHDKGSNKNTQPQNHGNNKGKK